MWKQPLSVRHLNKPFPWSCMEISPRLVLTLAPDPSLIFSLKEHASQHMAALLSVSGMSYFLPRHRCIKSTLLTACAAGLRYIMLGVYNLERTHKISTLSDDGRWVLGSASGLQGCKAAGLASWKAKYLQRLELTSVSVMQSAWHLVSLLFLSRATEL